MNESVSASAGPSTTDQIDIRLHTANFSRRPGAFDLATALLIVTIISTALWTFRDYAVSNDEGLQHHYGQLILEYYRSGMTDRTVFGFRDLYLYGGLFDIFAARLGEIFTGIDVYDLRHVLCALMGVCGVAATAATARAISGSRAGFMAAVALAVCGCWYGTMFNHTKDIPLAAGMIGATYILIRIMRQLPFPPLGNVLLFELLLGCALGIRVIALLMVFYVVFAVLLASPQPLQRHWRETGRFIARSIMYLGPAFVVAYLIMIAAWPWAALAPLNPIRGLFEFAKFQKHIETLLDGKIYPMEAVPRLYVPIYIMIRVSLMTLTGAVIALLFAGAPPMARRAAWQSSQRREIALVMLTVAFPLACQVVARGPAFTGLRHFTFVLPPIAVLAGIGIDAAAMALSSWRKPFGYAALVAAGVYFTWNASVLFRLHPYEYLYYNPVVGGLYGASRLYVTDYWVSIMPEAVSKLEDYLDRAEQLGGSATPHDYTVGVCGERVSFERERYAFERQLKRVRLHWTNNTQWKHVDFFIAPTHLSCDKIIDGKIIATISRLGVPIGYVKDRRTTMTMQAGSTSTAAANANPSVGSASGAP
jgi:hypothetical protein